ncbi:MAG: sulfatase-like hydrolase/transferase [Chitinophagaceae bacterium]
MLILINPLLSIGQSNERPNIILITTDQQSADAMSFIMGKRWLNTPNMDKLASEGVVFKNAYVANPICAPSRNSIITGLYPHITRIEGNKELTVKDNPNQRKKSWTTEDFTSMGTYFKNAGYETAYFGKWHLNYDPKDTNAHGFETSEFTTENGKDSELPVVISNFLEKQHTKPFLLFLSLLNPHNICEYARFQKLPDGPIEPVPQLQELLPPLKKNLLPPKNEADAMSLMRQSYHNNLKLFPVGNYTSKDWQRLAWGYYRLIEKTDSLVGKILTSIKENGYDKNTLIVFTSDHGECLGAHEFNQKTVFYEESAGVPFIVRYKGKLNPGTNNSLVNTGVDILPTLLDFACISQSNILTGKSLKEVASTGGKLSRSYIVIQNKMEQGETVEGTVPVVIGRMVRSDRYKYCLYDTLNKREELFDLKNDPGETKNLAGEKSMHAILVKHRSYLKEFAMKYKDPYAIKMLEYVKGK